MRRCVGVWVMSMLRVKGVRSEGCDLLLRACEPTSEGCVASSARWLCAACAIVGRAADGFAAGGGEGRARLAEVECR